MERNSFTRAEKRMDEDTHLQADGDSVLDLD